MKRNLQLCEKLVAQAKSGFITYNNLAPGEKLEKFVGAYVHFFLNTR
jgi:hypothetical protein